MPSVKFVKHPNFPQKKCFVTENGYFWKMNVREWAFAEINVANMVAGLTATSNNPTVVLGHTEKGKKGVKTTINKGQGTVKFYANQSGFTMIYLFDTDQFTPVDNVSIQIEVLGRRAPRENEISLTKLDDKTYAITSPDARAYIGDKTDIFNSSGATR
ncbi:MAG: hypothetical protein Q8S55_10925, partial [Methylococcaceae bacterium]|nr:hypothetical protein [Methylococcaceae bacterium]